MKDSRMLNRNVLLLNQNYEPLSICGLRKAVILLYLDKAEVIELDSAFIHSVNSAMQVPNVIRLFRYARAPKRKILLNRKNLLIRDNHACQYCGRHAQPLTIDHVIPKHYGGKDTWENLVIACLTCNNRKANRTPDQAEMKLRSLPRRPNPFFFFQHYLGARHESWRPYLFMGN
jgi:5-methylcytosine-specific restriction endonuclease McrA